MLFSVRAMSLFSAYPSVGLGFPFFEKCLMGESLLKTNNAGRVSSV